MDIKHEEVDLTFENKPVIQKKASLINKKMNLFGDIETPETVKPEPIHDKVEIHAEHSKHLGLEETGMTTQEIISGTIAVAETIDAIDIKKLYKDEVQPHLTRPEGKDRTPKREEKMEEQEVKKPTEHEEAEKKDQEPEKKTENMDTFEI